MKNIFEQKNSNGGNLENFNLVREPKIQLSEDGIGGCYFKVKHQGRSQRVHALRSSQGEIKLITRIKDEEILQKLKKKSEKFFDDEIKRNKINRKDKKKNKGAPKCPKCGSHHWPQDSCADWQFP